MAVDTFFEGSSGKRKRGGVKEKRGGSNAGGRGGGRVNGSSYKGKGREEPASRQRPKAKIHDEEIEGSDSEASNDGDSDLDKLNGNENDEEFESDEEADRKETPAQKRLRLAQQYLDTLKAAQEGELRFMLLFCCHHTGCFCRNLDSDRLETDLVYIYHLILQTK